MFFPVAVEADDFVVQFVNHQDVRRTLALGLLVVVKLQIGVDVVDLTQSVLVGLGLLALNLVIGFLDLVLVKLHRRLEE